MAELPHRLRSHEAVGIVTALGMRLKFPAGEFAVYEHPLDPEKMILLQVHRDQQTALLLEDLAQRGFSREQVEMAFETYQMSRLT